MTTLQNNLLDECLDILFESVKKTGRTFACAIKKKNCDPEHPCADCPMIQKKIINRQSSGPAENKTY